MTMYGYARVSTDKQDHDLQINALLKSGVSQENIFSDVISGSKTKRDGLDDLLDRLGSGDTLVVWKLDRLGRDTIHLMSLVRALVERGVAFKSLTESFDTSTPMGKAMFQIGCVFAELERETIRLRIKAGISAKMSAGRPDWGRRPANKYDKKEIIDLRSQGFSYREIAGRLGIGSSTVRRALAA